MLGGECPSAKLCHIVEPWFLGAGATGSSSFIFNILWRCIIIANSTYRELISHISNKFSSSHIITNNNAIGPGGPEFKEFKDKTEAENGVQFHTSLADVPAVADGVKRLALISGRTGDNPRLMTEAINAGCTVIYLEKPGKNEFICYT